MLKLPYERQKIEDDALPLQVAPGYLSVLTDNEAQGRWKDGNLVRFAPSSGLAQKLGGWVDETPSSTLKGAGRNTHDWTSLDTQQWTAIGTNSKLYVYNQGVAYDITPIRRTMNNYNNLNVVSGSHIVTVVDPLNGATAGDYVTLSGFSTIQGITGTFLNVEVQVLDAALNSWRFVAGGIAATGTQVGGGGQGVLEYQLNVMAASASALFGWGTGQWGEGTWDTPRSGSGSQTSNILAVVGIWSLDNWGEDLICSPRGGGVYIWKHATGPGARAAIISANAPIYNARVIVATESRQIICFGTSTLNSANQPYGALDPSLIAWCASEDYTTWFANATNNAGTYRLSAGSGIVSATKTRGGYFLGTTVNGNIFAPTGDTNVFSSTSLGKMSRPCGPNCAVDFNGVTYMMGVDNFMIFDGTMRTMPCDVWNKVYGSPETGSNLNNNQREKVFAFTNRTFSEVWWLYPSVASTDGENDSYVCYNWLLSCWHYGHWRGNAGGDINRSCGHDYSDQFFAPYMFWYNPSSDLTKMYQHETGNLANGSSAFGEYLESWDVDVMQSGQLVNIKHMIPNFKDGIISTATVSGTPPTISGTIQIIVKIRKYPVDTYKTKGPYNVNATTQKVSARGRGRQIALRIYSSAPGAGSVTAGIPWTMGTWRTQTGEDGDR